MPAPTSSASDRVSGNLTCPRPFVSLINEAAQKSGTSVRWISEDWISEDWIARLEREEQVRYVHGSSFPLNNAAAALIATDKVATFTVLTDAGITAVPHFLVRIPSPDEPRDAVDRALSLVRPPFVVKPNGEKGGRDVFRVESAEDARALIDRLAIRYPMLALCPFETILTEHRVVMLDDDPLLFFRKEITNTTEWRHNLKHGARPVIDESLVTQKELTAIARQAMRAIGARFMTVDIISTPSDRKVLEINDGVTLDRFAAHSQAHRALAVDIYHKAIGHCFSAPENRHL